MSRGCSASLSGAGLSGGSAGPMWSSTAPLRGGAVDVLHCRDGIPGCPARAGTAQLLGQGGSQVGYDGRARMVLFPQPPSAGCPELAGFRRQGLGGQCGSLQGLGGAAELRAQQVLRSMPRIRKIRKGSRSNSSPSSRYTAATCLHGLDQSGTSSPSPGRPAGQGTWNRPAARKVSSMLSGMRPDKRLAAMMGCPPWPPGGVPSPVG